MPYIIKNGKTYTGNSISLTQAQYNALSDAEKNNGITYYIYDSDAVLDASDVGLGAGSVETLAGSVAVIETSPATASHAVGDYILWNGQLYTVIAPIDVGESLTVGSNITATSAGSELTSLKSGLSQIFTTEFSFSGEPDSYKQIVSNCPLNGYIPIAVIRPSRSGWIYNFTQNTSLSTSYWAVEIISTSTVSGTYSGTIVAINKSAIGL